MSSGAHDPALQVNMVKLVGVASKIIAADEQQSKQVTEVKLTVRYIFNTKRQLLILCCVAVC